MPAELQAIHRYVIETPVRSFHQSLDQMPPAAVRREAE